MRSAAAIRAKFPALRGPSPWAFFENAGGSQVPDETISAMVAHLERNMVQLGAGYEQSDAATRTVRRAHRVAEVFAGGGGGARRADGFSVLGASTSALLCWTMRWRW